MKIVPEPQSRANQTEGEIVTQSITKERLAAFSDGVFAVIITIMVLQLRLPQHASFNALFAEWPTALSYVVSYFLIVIMWINHHFLWSFAKHSTPKLVLWNFVHMLSASLVPFATAWVAASQIAAVPVFVYAAVIILVNLSYHGFAYEVVPRGRGELDPKIRRRALGRSALTLGLFTAAMFLSLKLPLAAFALVTCVLITYARPEIPALRVH
ncbi:MAG TPA: TMEM175 family protein [Candidatus Cybelea sp.]|nr:TMEM175 family protein [Candidatus Cybelea sp.]